MMPRDMILPGAIAGLAVVAVVAGLSVAGGPERARAEDRDRARLEALHKAQDLVECLAKHNDRTLPEHLAANPSCASLEVLNDPYSGTPVGYEVRHGSMYRLCPELELPEDQEHESHVAGGKFDQVTDCVRYIYHP